MITEPTGCERQSRSALADKKDWPEWQAPAEMVERKLAPSGVMKGGTGNPLGASLLLLDDSSLSIHA